MPIRFALLTLLLLAARPVAAASSDSITLDTIYSAAAKPRLEERVYKPTGLAVGPSGCIYVVDQGNARLLKIAPSGEVLFEFGTKGEGAIRPHQESGALIVADAAERIYVKVPRDPNVRIYDANGAFLRHFKLPFQSAAGLAVLRTGEVAVAPLAADLKYAVYVFSPEGALLRAFGEPLVAGRGALADQLHGAVIATTARDEIFVAYLRWPVVRKYSASGQLLSEKSYTLPPAVLAMTDPARTLEAIRRAPDAAIALPFAAISISIDAAGDAYVFTNGYGLIAMRADGTVRRQTRFEIPESWHGYFFVELRCAPGGDVLLLDAKSANVFRVDRAKNPLLFAR